jgi:hypothetical protein
MWIISKLVDRIFYKGLTRARKERSRFERDAASIGGISAFRKLPACLPQKGAGTGKESFDEITEHPRHS